jgi:hypothetical protein
MTRRTTRYPKLIRNRFCAFTLALMVSLASATAKGDKTETFDSAASAAAHGWTATGSGVDAQIAGWIETNDAGGAAPGEAQYDVARGAELGYFDANIGMTVGAGTAFSATGKLNYFGKGAGVPDTGFPPILGFFGSSGEFVGIFFRGDEADLGDDLSWGLRWRTDEAGDDLRASLGGDFSRILTQGQSYDFSLAYDPTEGAFGSITASVAGAGGEIKYFISEGRSPSMTATALDKFGFIKIGNAPDPDHAIQLRMDDVTYTGVASPGGLMADFDADNDVDGADFLKWQQDGLGQAELTNWKTEFGMVAPLVSAAAAVPEPATFVLLGIAFACGSRRFRSAGRN